ncbi:MAG TPA: lytic murein transglycosylase, partial [Gammaproteobacteria bacterium]|nr:lytic murein transglycosylase [Gammaproteobacteria bacterium]
MIDGAPTNAGTNTAARGRRLRRLGAACIALALCALARADDRADVAKARGAFVDKMVAEHGFDRAALTATLTSATIDKQVLDAIAKPAERVVPWYEYRAIFVNDARIATGVRFWTEHAATIQQVADQYGVAPEMLVAIVGVETY